MDAPSATVNDRLDAFMDTAGLMRGPARTVPQAAWYLGVSRALLYRYLAAGTIAHIKVGRRTLILQPELDRFLEARMQEAQRQPVGAR
jgi:excisionase family DNA binding protein